MDQEKTARRTTEKKFRSKLDEMALRMGEIEILLENHQQNSDQERSALKQEKGELREKLSKIEEKFNEESESKKDVEKRIQSLESKSESFASKLSLFEKLSNTEGRSDGREPRRPPPVTSIPTSSSGNEGFTESLAEKRYSVSGAEAEDQTTRRIKTAARKEAMEKIRGAEELWYSPSVSDIREAADLVNTGYLTSLKYLYLCNLDLSSSDEADIKSLLSVCTDRVIINNVRGGDLVIKHLNSKELWIHGQTLSASETADLVTSMRDRVERVVLISGVTLDVETVDTRIGELRQGTCSEILCEGNTRNKYREHLTRWADTIGWRTKDDNYTIRIYK